QSWFLVAGTIAPCPVSPSHRTHGFLFHPTAGGALQLPNYVRLAGFRQYYSFADWQWYYSFQVSAVYQLY
ncbi:hypothetical protein CH063_09970, partial [Colletotrichum higginsianum]